jgi:hypothetical protein
MSFKPEVATDSSGKFYGNALAFATREEAEGNARDLMFRWTLVHDCRAVESDQPVNYSYVNGALKAVEVAHG